MWKLWFNNIRKLPFVHSPQKQRIRSKFYADLSESTLRVPTHLSNTTLDKSSSDIDIARSTALATFTDPAKGTIKY